MIVVWLHADIAKLLQQAGVADGAKSMVLLSGVGHVKSNPFVSQVQDADIKLVWRDSCLLCCVFVCFAMSVWLIGLQYAGPLPLMQR